METEHDLDKELTRLKRNFNNRLLQRLQSIAVPETPTRNVETVSVTNKPASYTGIRRLLNLFSRLGKS